MFWYLVLLMVLIVPLSMLIIGDNLKRNAPKEVSVLFGYRTKRSVKNKETWEFANKEFGRLLFKTGVIVAIVSVIVYISLIGITYKDFVKASIVGLIMMTLQIIIIVIPYIMVEKKLKENETRGNNE
ncbi:MAG: SdpI family protein [Acholeplasma sp.]|nr:SdpI family protein [Acholeplasma sp.]